jgi:hypothetical protein
VNTGSQREGKQVRGECRLTVKGQTGQGEKRLNTERTNRSGMNTGLQREDRQVRGEYRLTERGQTGQG